MVQCGCSLPALSSCFLGLSWRRPASESAGSCGTDKRRSGYVLLSARIHQ